MRRYILPIGLLVVTIGIASLMPTGLQIPVAMTLIIASYVLMRLVAAR